MPGIVKIINEAEETIAAYCYHSTSDRNRMITTWNRERVSFYAIQIYPHTDIQHVKKSGENFRRFKESGR